MKLTKLLERLDYECINGSLDVDVTDNGWLGPDPLETATPEWGREMLEAAAKWAVDFIGAFRKAEF